MRLRGIRLRYGSIDMVVVVIGIGIGIGVE